MSSIPTARGLQAAAAEAAFTLVTAAGVSIIALATGTYAVMHAPTLAGKVATVALTALGILFSPMVYPLLRRSGIVQK